MNLLATPVQEPEIRGQRYTVMGLARTGEAAARFLANRGAYVTVTDRRFEEELKSVLSRLPTGISKALGGHPEKLFKETDGVVVSPGVSREHPLLDGAKAAGVPVWSEIELAYRFCKVPIIAVTGTNGKTTTAHLIHTLLEAGGLRAPKVGNIGEPFIAALSEKNPSDFMVVEVSSFQLEWIETFRPFAAVVTNISPDHLDRHQDLAEYISWKKRIFAFQKSEDFLVLNEDDKVVRSFAGAAQAKVRTFSRKIKPTNGTCLEDGNLVLRTNGASVPILPSNDFALHGVHNIENALAAIAVTNVCNVSEKIMGPALRSILPIEHRLMLIRERSGVRWYNDSKGTNVGAAVRSIESFEEPIILIAGGRDKHSDLTPLRPLVRNRVKNLILIGEARARFRSAFAGLTECKEAESMAEAVRTADQVSRAGDIVLLSPACASFDMFENYEDRGIRFTNEVKKLSP